MKLTVTYDDKVVQLDVYEDMELENLTAYCEAEMGNSFNELQFLFNANPLMDKQKTLKQYGIEDGDMLLVVKKTMVQSHQAQVDQPQRNPQVDYFRRAAAAVDASPSLSATASTSAYETLDNDGVRPPIAPVRQILNPNPIGYPSVELTPRYSTRSARPSSDVYDAFRDFRAEAEWQEMTQEGNSNALSNPTDANGAVAAGTRPMTTLQDLFRPPLDLMFRGSLTSSREAATIKNKWMLVNIQNGREFACQTLNRDVWSNQTVKDIVKEHFLFWQVYHDSYEGQRYVLFYNVKRFPHVAIIDPRTGELMKSWPTTIDHNSFCDSVIEFLAEHPSPDGSGDANTMKKLRIKDENEDGGNVDDHDVVDVDVDDDDDDDVKEIVVHPLYDQSEEAQLEAAIKASLQEPEPECKIALRFPDGSSLVQRFSARERLSTVRSFVQIEKSTACASAIEFIAPPNRKLTEANMNETLESLGLCPASRLEVKCVLD